MSSEPPLVSVVTPSYQQARFLEETIQSVLAQDYPRVEYIVVDGGSTDGSLEIVQRHADRLAWWVSEPDEGQAQALNRGFARATGTYLTWVNSDDTLLPGALTRLVAELEAHPQAALAYGDSLFIDAQSRPAGPLVARPWDVPTMVRRWENHVPQPSSLFRRDAYEKVGPLNERGYYFFDFELFLGLATVGEVRQLEGSPLSGYRLHDDSKSIGAPLRKAADYRRVAEEFLVHGKLPAEARPFVREGQARAWLGAAEYSYAADDQGAARRAFIRALGRAPRALGRRDWGLAARIALPGPLARRLKERRATRR
jgi:glycosyltransferase involved in cell wall biosynthesis